MQKISLAIILAVGIMSAHATITPLSPQKGLNVISLDSMSLPENINNHVIKSSREMKEKGYIESESNSYHINYLLNLEKTAPIEIRQYKTEASVYDTHIKSDLTQIKLAYPFSVPSIINSKSVLGYTSEGGWVK